MLSYCKGFGDEDGETRASCSGLAKYLLCGEDFAPLSSNCPVLPPLLICWYANLPTDQPIHRPLYLPTYRPTGYHTSAAAAAAVRSVNNVSCSWACSSSCRDLVVDVVDVDEGL